MTPLTIDFADLTLEDVPRGGGKNASLGELFRYLKPQGVGVVDGFATTADAFRLLLADGDLGARLHAVLAGFDPEDLPELARRGHAARSSVLETPLPAPLCDAVRDAYRRLCARHGAEVSPCAPRPRRRICRKPPSRAPRRRS